MLKQLEQEVLQVVGTENTVGEGNQGIVSCHVPGHTLNEPYQILLDVVIVVVVRHHIDVANTQSMGYNTHNLGQDSVLHFY